MSRDKATLVDILVAARHVIEFTAGLERETFLRTRLAHSAVLHEFMVMGEAAKRLSTETRRRHPEIPWKDIAGLRDKLIHGYRDVDLELVWNIATNETPRLIRQIEPLVRPDSGSKQR